MCRSVKSGLSGVKHESRIAQLRLLVLDVDGVLTDGSISLDGRGVESKRFHVRDGLGIKAAQMAGIAVAVLSARSSEAVTLRMRDLGVELVSQGSADKGQTLHELARTVGVSLGEVAFMGDDLQDLPAMRACGYAMAVDDAAAEVRQAADYVTTRPGGQGAVREAVEHLLKVRGQWQDILAKVAGEAPPSG